MVVALRNTEHACCMSFISVSFKGTLNTIAVIKSYTVNGKGVLLSS